MAISWFLAFKLFRHPAQQLRYFFAVSSLRILASLEVSTDLIQKTY
jgi:hypothetical protein